MTTEETAAQIGEFAVAKLDVKPGDVVAIKTNLIPEEGSHLAQMLSNWSDNHELGLHFMVMAGDWTSDITVIRPHTLTSEEVERAGAGGWPHEGQT